LTPERKDCDRFRGILQQAFGNKNPPLGVKFINPIHDILGPDRRATAKGSYEDQED
jgi:hypothetical protein